MYSMLLHCNKSIHRFIFNHITRMEGYIAEIRLFAATFAPRNWAYCQGQTISIAQNSALFSLLGTTYGGDGVQTFKLPNFASRQARGAGSSPGLSTISLGELSGSESVNMNTAQMPAHTHVAMVRSSSNSSNTINPVGGGYGPVNVQVQTPGGVTATGNLYASTSNAAMNPDTVNIGISGNSVPFPVMNPYLAMNYIICLVGIYPSRS
jgi:microcystin-dependent protein